MQFEAATTDCAQTVGVGRGRPRPAKATFDTPGRSPETPFLCVRALALEAEASVGGSLRRAPGA
eukprot:15441739-Alexandrium_andersonii.AAC.1